MNIKKSLQGKKTVVVGSSSTLLQTIIRALVGAGSSVVVGELNEEPNPESSAIGTTWPLDVEDPRSWDRFARTSFDQLGGVDVYVHCANTYGLSARRAWNELTVSEWDQASRVNVRGVWLGCRAFSPHLVASDYGRAILVGSTSAWEGTPGFLHYTTSQSALIGLNRALARELGDKNVGVNMVCPGLDFEGETGQGDDGLVEQLGVLPRPSSAESNVAISQEIADAVVFLAGPSSDFITGQSWLIDGGRWFQ